MAWDQEGEPGSFEQLGRYTLLTEIAEGQLTTVYLARQQSEAGFTRLVALKRLSPELAGQREYVELLQDEAHIGAGLNHANLVAAIDVGGGPGECFVAYEYVEGDSLAGLLRRPDAGRHPRFLAPLFVDALTGLHAAHHAAGPDGESLQLVHQAPHADHILVGIDGIARIADFGQVRSPALRPNRLRNDRLRIGYMAPEQVLRPDVVDLRADIFILGIALWESLTGRRLFESYSEEQSFQNLLHRGVQAPSDINRSLPPCFDDVCLRALERDPGERFESAAEMARELRDTAINNALFATGTEVGQWVKALCGSELIARRRLAGSESPSQQMRVLPRSERSAARTVPMVGEPSSAFDEEITRLHLSPSTAADSDSVPILIDEFDDDGHPGPAREEGSWVANAPLAEGYEHKPDSGELPDLSDERAGFEEADPDNEGPTHVYESLPPSEPPSRPSAPSTAPPPASAFGPMDGGPEHEVPTRVMPAPSERASAYARAHASGSQRPEALDEPTPTPHPTSLWESEGSVPSPLGVSTAPPSRPASTRPRRPDYREEMAAAPGERRDSTPTRMKLSTGPVGDVFGSSAPPASPPPADLMAMVEPQEAADGSASAALPAPPSAASPTSSLRVWPSGSADDGSGAYGEFPDSLTPPSQSHVLPDELAPRRGSRAAKLVVLGFVGVAAALAFVWVFARPGAESTHVAGEPARVADPDLATGADTQPAEGKEPALEPTAGHEPQAEEEPAEQAAAAEAAAPRASQGKGAARAQPRETESAAAARPRRTRPSGSRASPRSEKRSPGRPAPRASAPAKPAPVEDEPRARQPAPAAEKPAPASRGAAARGEHDWRTRGDEIPDNPF